MHASHRQQLACSWKPPHVACACVTIVIVRSDRGYKVASACSLQQSCFGCIHDALLLFAWSGWPAVSDPKASSGLRIWKRGQIVRSIPSRRRYPAPNAGEFGAGSYPRHFGIENDTPLKRLDATTSTSTIARSSADAFIFRPRAKLILTRCICAFSVARTTRQRSLLGHTHSLAHKQACW